MSESEDTPSDPVDVEAQRAMLKFYELITQDDITYLHAQDIGIIDPVKGQLDKGNE